MDFTKFDISILLTMSLSIIVMSFMFPALGMSDAGSVNESEIPEFNASASSFDLVGEYPEEPSRPTSGTLEYDQEKGNSIRGITFVPISDEYLVEVQNTSSKPPNFVLVNLSSTTGNAEQEITGEEGQEILIEDGDWTVTATINNVENFNESNMTFEAEWNIKSAPSDTSGISSIPLIGGFADGVANTLGQLAVTFAWASAVIVETLISGVIVVFNLAQYMIGMGFWLVSTYSAIIASAPSWAGVVLAVPAILLFAEFAKLTAIVISLFPTT